MARRTISVEILGDYSSLQKTFKGASHSAQAFNRDLGRSARGAVAASVSFRGLGRSIAFASSYFLGGAGIVYGIRSTISAAEESQRVLGQTQVAVRKSGLSWAQYGEQIRQAALAESNLSGFDDERLLGTFSLLVRRTGDVNRALQLNALAADVARGRNISLESAAQLVIKASIGQAGALRRMGINAKLGSTGLQLIDMLSKKYAGSAEAYGQTAAGAQDRFRVAVQNLQEAIGAGLLPEITKLLNPLSNWLNDSQNQERVQRDVTTAVKDGAAVAREFASDANSVAHALGGWKNTLEALIALKFATVVGGWTSALVAYNGTARTAEARSLALKATLAKLAAIGVITIGVELVLNKNKIDKAVSGFFDKHGLGFLNGGKINLPKGATAADVQGLIAQAQAVGAPSLEIEALKKYLKTLQKPESTKNSAAPGMGPHHDTGFSTSVSSASAGSTAGRRGLSLQGQLNLAELAAAQAATTQSVVDDVAALRKKAAILHAMIAKGGTLAQQTQRNQDLASVLDQINSINAAQQKADNATAKAAKKPKQKAKAKAKAAVEFVLPFKLQLDELKAQLTKSAADDRKVALAEKRFAEKMIKSGKLRGQALLDAWRQIIDANNKLADQQTQQTRQVAATSTRLLTAGLGLTQAQRASLEQRFAQAEAHPGMTPGQVAANGIVINGDLNLHGVHDVKTLAGELTKRAKRNSGQSRGTRPGSYLGHH